jgi:pimeloyl-ACP methyl ester carboxylesterase
MRTELVTIQTPTIPIDGAFHQPDAAVTAGAVLLFHGNTMNFYTGMARFLPPVLTRLGFACLAFNRRGHDVVTTRNSRAAEGGAFQTTAEAIEDNRLAAQWLAAKGYAAPVVIGHSNGGMLATQHVTDHPQTPAMVLLSAGRGGRSSMQAGGRDGLGAGEQFPDIHARAVAAVNAGRPREMMLMPGWWYVISAESFLDRIETVPDTIALAPGIKCPVLCIRGDQEPRDRYPAEEYAAAAGGPCKVQIVPQCDHFYNGREDVVAGHVADWLAATLKLPRNN